MAASTSESVLAIAWCQWVYLLICLLLSFSMTFKFVLNRNELHIAVRLPISNYIFLSSQILMVVGRMFLEPHNCPFSYCYLIDDGSYTQSSTMQIINGVAFGARVTLLGTGYLMKLWFLYYSLKFQTIILNEEWWTQINKNLNENWWIKNVNKYGKTNKKMFIILFSIMIFTVIFGIISAVKVKPDIPRYIAYIEFMIVAVCVVVFYCKIPKINDIYGIKKEIKLLTILNTLGFFYFPITEIASGGDERIFALSMINGIVVGILCVIVVWGATIYPNTLFLKAFQHKQISRTDDWIAIVFENVDTLHSFMRFLCRSFCVENMLFIIETMQWKQEFIKIHCNKTDELDHGKMITFYKNNKIPKSDIVYGDNNYNVNQQIVAIYDKYVSDNASLQINISFQAKQKLEETILKKEFDKNEDHQFLIKILDEAIEEILRLLNSSVWKWKKDDLTNDINEQIVIALQQQTKK